MKLYLKTTVFICTLASLFLHSTTWAQVKLGEIAFTQPVDSTKAFFQLPSNGPVVTYVLRNDDGDGNVINVDSRSGAIYHYGQQWLRSEANFLASPNVVRLQQLHSIRKNLVPLNMVTTEKHVITNIYHASKQFLFQVSGLSGEAPYLQDTIVLTKKETPFLSITRDSSFIIATFQPDNGQLAIYQKSGLLPVERWSADSSDLPKEATAERAAWKLALNNLNDFRLSDLVPLARYFESSRSYTYTQLGGKFKAFYNENDLCFVINDVDNAVVTINIDLQNRKLRPKLFDFKEKSLMADSLIQARQPFLGIKRILGIEATAFESFLMDPYLAIALNHWHALHLLIYNRHTGRIAQMVTLNKKDTTTWQQGFIVAEDSTVMDKGERTVKKYIKLSENLPASIQLGHGSDGLLKAEMSTAYELGTYKRSTMSLLVGDLLDAATLPARVYVAQSLHDLFGAKLIHPGTVLNYTLVFDANSLEPARGGSIAYKASLPWQQKLPLIEEYFRIERAAGKRLQYSIHLWEDKAIVMVRNFTGQKLELYRF